MRNSPFQIALAVITVVGVTACGHTSANQVQATTTAPEKYVPPRSIMVAAPAPTPTLTPSSPLSSAAEGEEKSVSLFDKVDPTNLGRTFSHILEDYVKTDVGTPALFYGMVRGMVAALDDPYSSYMDPGEAKMFVERMTGNFAGIGAVLGVKDGMLTVMSVIEASPAEAKGIKPGDIIAEVDGESMFDQSLDKTVMRIRGEPGTAVKLLIGRKGEKKPLELTVTRAAIPSPPPVAWKTVKEGKKTFMYIEYSSFNEEAKVLFRKAAAEVIAKRVDGIVFDERGNPGGDLNVADDVICHWVKPEETTVIMQYHGPLDVPRVCDGVKPILAGLPTVLLINQYSASASEIMAGALQDYGLARIIGVKSFGKGCGQDVIQYKDGSLLKLTTFYWKTPKGRLIHKLGITPDEEVENDEDEANGDEQLKRAYDFLVHGK